MEALHLRSMTRKLHKWTPKEDELLVGCLLQLVEEGRLITENGFRSFIFQEIEKMMEEKVDGCRIKATPDIASQVKKMKEDWMMIYEMIHNTHNLGFQWDEKEKLIIAEENVWDDYMRDHKKAAKLRGKSFPHFDALNIVFNNGKIVEEDPHVHNGVVKELEVLYDEVLKVEGIIDEEHQQAYVKLIKDDELRVVFPDLPIDGKKALVIKLFE